MALILKDAQTDTLARELGRLTDETLTEAVRIALAERLARERLKRGRPADLAGELLAIARRSAARPILDTRTNDDILGYHENGLPT